MNTIVCPKTAYIVGVYMGDGSYEGTTARATLKFVMEDVDVLETVARFHHEISGHSCHPRPLSGRPHLTCLRLTDTRLARAIRTTTEGKNRLPLLGNEPAKREFVAGLMDTDGHVRHGRTVDGKNNRFALMFTNSGKWLPDFLSLMREFGVKIGHPTLKRKYRSQTEVDCWQVGINFRSFAESGLFFRCTRKQDVVHTYLNLVRRQNF